MDLSLAIITLALASAACFAPLDPQLSRLLEVAVAALLGVLVLLKLFRRTGSSAPPQVKEKPAATPDAPPPAPELAAEAGVVQFLARLQEKGRLVDFLMDDITPYSNEQIGVVARVVHMGCREVLRGSFDIKPVHPGAEREAIVLAGDFDAASYRLVGRVPEHPPYQGTVLYRGWKATRVNLPRVTEAGRDSAARQVFAPAEVEIG